jgi:hypothetical protein
MSEIKVNKISPRSGTDVTLGDSADTITIPSGATLDASNATVTYPAGSITDAAISSTAAIQQSKISGSPGFRNIVINGDMSIAQRGTSVASITTGGYKTLDRFQADVTNIGTWTQSQSTDTPTGQGFATSLKMDCTTADASPGAGDLLRITQRIEGQNIQYLKKGTANAVSLTLSFWVKSNKTGTYIAELFDDNSRSISKSYTVDVTDTWEKKTITYEGDTTGTIDNDNTIGLSLHLWLAAGSTYTSGTLQTSWGAVTSANRAVGQVNLADDTANEWYITGVQLEAGTTASDFEFLPVDVNEKRCNRYYYTTSDWKGGYYLGVTIDPSQQGALCVTNLKTSDINGQGVRFPVRMRAAPTITFYPRASTTSGSILYDGSNQTAVGAQISSVGTGYIQITSGSASEISFVCYAYKADAEL